MLRRSLSILAAVAIAATPIVCRGDSAKCGSGLTSQADLVSLVDSINDIALTQSSSSMLPWPLARNPFSDWYVRFVTAMGTDNPPTAQQRDAASALINEVGSVDGVSVSAAVWSNSDFSSFGNSAAERLRSLCVRATMGSWAMRKNEPSEVEPQMEGWLDAQASNMPIKVSGVKDFVETLSSGATRVTARSSHPFNVLATLSLRTAVGIATEAPSMQTIPFYDDGKVEGLELQSPSHIALYLFTTDPDDMLTFISRFHGSTNASFNGDVPGYAVAHWKAIQNQFKPRPIGLTPVDFLFRGRQGFNPSLDAHSQHLDAFGTTISTPYSMFTGLSEAQLSLTGSHLSLFVESGIEGTDAPKRMTYDEFQHTVRPTFALPWVLYFVVDDQNGLILSYGFQRSLR